MTMIQLTIEVNIRKYSLVPNFAALCPSTARQRISGGKQKTYSHVCIYMYFMGFLPGAFTPLTASGVWRAPVFTFSTRITRSFVSTCSRPPVLFRIVLKLLPAHANVYKPTYSGQSLQFSSVPRKKAERRVLCNILWQTSTYSFFI